MAVVLGCEHVAAAALVHIKYSHLIIHAQGDVTLGDLHQGLLVIAAGGTTADLIELWLYLVGGLDLLIKVGCQGSLLRLHQDYFVFWGHTVGKSLNAIWSVVRLP